MDRATLIRTAWPEKYQADRPDPHGKVKSYQANFCAEVETRFGFAGKRVLEVGGALNRDFVLNDLQVKSWTAIQELSYWESIGRGTGDLGTIDYPSFDAADPKTLGPYQVITAPIERLPEKFYESFDLVISIAAFTFVQQVGPALDKIYRGLSPGGGFAVMAAQIWSSESGLFYHTVTDKMGRLFSSYPIAGHSNPVLPWWHLLVQPTDMYDRLCRTTDCEAAGNIVQELFYSRRINRLFAEDYAKYFATSPFQRYGKMQTNIAQQDLPNAALQKKLEARHPGRRDFNTHMILAYGQRLI
ncbi:MAG: methyltransferase domain-containing protein [Rhodospirillaceae bacterium]|nr:methyltransferase domain-containing protein [Rhodospirillaceae bacterium]